MKYPFNSPLDARLFRSKTVALNLSNFKIIDRDLKSRGHFRRRKREEADMDLAGERI